MGVDSRTHPAFVCTRSLRAVPTCSPLTASLFTRATPPGRRVGTEENTLSNQCVPDKLPHVSAERWLVGREAAGQTSTDGQEEGREIPLHVPALTTMLRLRFKKIL